MPEEGGAPVSLIDDLRTIGVALTPSDVPSTTELQHIVGALVKVLDHNGTPVADELYPKDDSAAVPGAPAGSGDAQTIEQLTARIRQLEAQQAGPADPADTPADAGPVPPAGPGGEPPEGWK